MAVIISKKLKVQRPPVAVEISGTGDADNCYAIIDGVKKYAAESGLKAFERNVTFGVYGWDGASRYGDVYIDGVRVVLATAYAVETYRWEIPNNVSRISISMSVPYTNGHITVTTS